MIMGIQNIDGKPLMRTNCNLQTQARHVWSYSTCIINDIQTVVVHAIDDHDDLLLGKVCVITTYILLCGMTT